MRYIESPPTLVKSSLYEFLLRVETDGRAGELRLVLNGVAEADQAFLGDRGDQAAVFGENLAKVKPARA